MDPFSRTGRSMLTAGNQKTHARPHRFDFSIAFPGGEIDALSLLCDNGYTMRTDLAFALPHLDHEATIEEAQALTYLSRDFHYDGTEITPSEVLEQVNEDGLVCFKYGAANRNLAPFEACVFRGWLKFDHDFPGFDAKVFKITAFGLMRLKQMAAGVPFQRAPQVQPERGVALKLVASND